MARGGINKVLVRRARDALLARNIHPSIDAVRVQLGDTGSRTTIQRYLKELTETEKTTSLPTLDEELMHVISSLAERLKEDARLAVATDQARADESWRRQAEAQEQQRELVVSLKENSQQLSEQNADYREREHALQSQVAELLQTCETQQTQAQEWQLAISARDLQIQSLNERVEQLRASLVHGREQQRLQFEQNRERHDRQMEQLQRELRGVQSSLLEKQEALANLCRDNERLLAEHRLATKQVLSTKQDYRRAQADWVQQAHTHQETQLRLQMEQSGLRERLQAALLKQRSDARRLRAEHRQVERLHHLLEAATVAADLSPPVPASGCRD